MHAISSKNPCYNFKCIRMYVQKIEIFVLHLRNEIFFLHSLTKFTALNCLLSKNRKFIFSNVVSCRKLRLTSTIFQASVQFMQQQLGIISIEHIMFLQEHDLPM